jgi:hypothetical protein
MNLKEFPYDLFHICSHGGEIDGYNVDQSFIDRDGVSHNINYDLVLSFSPSMRKGLIQVQHKWYPKMFDGFTWRSAELKEKKLPQYVFADMVNAIRNSKASEKKMTPKNKIPNSYAIKCADSTHQGMFYSIASHSSPLIFNNTCWSWFDIAQSFLVNGARGYIGTLWAVENDPATAFATRFYQNAFSEPISIALHTAMDETKGTESEGIYIYWGLHFSRVAKLRDLKSSKLNVINALKRAFYLWMKHLSSAKSEDSLETTKDYIKWINFELTTMLKDESINPSSH